MPHIEKIVPVALLVCTAVLTAAQPGTNARPGSQPHIPTRIEWLTTTMQASLRTDLTEENRYLIQITSPDSETLLIYVRYLPNVNREVMNLSIDSAREVIKITAKGYGWDKWLRIREDIQLATVPRK